MDQNKIGNTISKKRKELKITQKNLAELLNVSDKTVSNWERGKYLPDYSLLIPLCKSLKITISELLTGEKEKEITENIVNLVSTNDKLTKLGYIISAVGVSFTIYSLTFMRQITTVGNGIFSLVGFIISFYGYILISRNYKKRKKCIHTISFIISYFLMIIFFDLNGIMNYNANSLFSYSFSVDGNNTLSQTPFYDLIRCNNKKYKIIFHKKDNYNNINNICKNS